ncbi:MAG: insulinase family protein [Actinomycetia bacterium]|nr:insulinase family protein [Actinomycetes bacterium]
MLFSGTTKEGLGVYLYPTERFKTIAIHAVWVQDLDPARATVSALVPAVLRRGTRRWPTFTAMEAHLDELYGGAFRADVGKLGDKQLLSFHLEVPDGRFLPGRPDTFSAGVEFLSVVMKEPHWPGGRLPAGVLDQEKELLRRQMQAVINDKAQYATLRLIEHMAAGERWGLRRYGRPEDLAGVDEERLRERYDAILREAPLYVFVVGAVDPDHADQVIRGHWQGRPAAALGPIPRFAPRHERDLVVEEQDVQQGKLNLGYATGRRLTDPDYPALMMYAGVLGGYPHSKLFVNVREKASLAYYAYARLDGALGLMLIGSGIEFAHFRPALAIIEEQVAAMAEGRITEQEMAFTLSSYLNDLRTEEDSPSSLIGRQLERLLVGGGLLPDELAPALERVTVADVTRVAESVALDTIYFLTRTGEGVHAGLH